MKEELLERYRAHGRRGGAAAEVRLPGWAGGAAPGLAGVAAVHTPKF